MKFTTSNKIACSAISLLLIFILLPACKKSNGSQEPKPEQPKDSAVPPPTPVATSIITYIVGNSQTGNPVDLSVNNISSLYNPQYNAFHSVPLQTDMYETRISARYLMTGADTRDYFNMQRILPVTNSIRNYIDATITKRQLSYFQINQQRNGNGTLPDGATYTFGPPNPDPGGTQGYGYSAFLAPTASSFALSMPSFWLDSADTRWYLKSFGAYYFDFPVFDQTAIKLTFPIQASMVNTAPDSIFCYSFKNWKWSKGGVAKKVNNTYVASFRGNGLWSFAAPVKGDYLKLKVRTDSAATITNTKVVAKVNAAEVATARTDATGNVLLFVPVNEPITLELSDNTLLASYNAIEFGAITKASEKEVILPQKKSTYLLPINARVLDCLGNPVQQGTAVLSISRGMPKQYYIPIQNGAFNTALYADGGGDVNVTVFDASNRPVGAVNEAMFSMPLHSTDAIAFYPNFYACSNYKNLYCNYTFDGTTYFQKDDAGASSSFLTVSAANRINTQQGNLGIDIPFSYPLKEGPFNYFSGSVIVNGVTYQVDKSTTNTATYIYKLDPDASGYTEGWVTIRLKDNAGTPHKLIAVFRLKNKS